MSNLFKYLWKGSLLLVSFTFLGLACSDIISISKKDLKKYVNKKHESWEHVGPVGNRPLFIINGRIVTDILSIDIDPVNIDSLAVLKGKKAIKTYGQSGKNGVVLIYTEDSVKAKPDSILTSIGFFKV